MIPNRNRCSFCARTGKDCYGVSGKRACAACKHSKRKCSFVAINQDQPSGSKRKRVPLDDFVVKDKVPITDRSLKPASPPPQKSYRRANPERCDEVNPAIPTHPHPQKSDLDTIREWTGVHYPWTRVNGVFVPLPPHKFEPETPNTRQPSPSPIPPPKTPCPQPAEPTTTPHRSPPPPTQSPPQPLETLPTPSPPPPKETATLSPTPKPVLPNSMSHPTREASPTEMNPPEETHDSEASEDPTPRPGSASVEPVDEILNQHFPSSDPTIYAMRASVLDEETTLFREKLFKMLGAAVMLPEEQRAIGRMVIETFWGWKSKFEKVIPASKDPPSQF